MGRNIAIYADCFILAGMIGSVEFMHCVRETNEVAHSLAKYAYDSNSSCKWVDEPPDFLVNAIANDVTILTIQ